MVGRVQRFHNMVHQWFTASYHHAAYTQWRWSYLLPSWLPSPHWCLNKDWCWSIFAFWYTNVVMFMAVRRYSENNETGMVQHQWLKHTTKEVKDPSAFLAIGKIKCTDIHKILAKEGSSLRIVCWFLLLVRACALCIVRSQFRPEICGPQFRPEIRLDPTGSKRAQAAQTQINQVRRSGGYEWK